LPATPTRGSNCFLLLLLLLLMMMLLLLQLTEQVQRINSKLQNSISTLSETVVGNGSAAAGVSSSAAPAAANSSSGTRAKIDTMSAEVVDSNPYSRLMALQRMGIVKDYERIRSKTVSEQ
jgi:ubiquitin-like modifier-activating enzyme 5